MRMGHLGCLKVRPTWEMLYRSGLSAAIGRRYAGIGSIFMFHHVVPDVSTHLNGDLYIRTGFLDAWLTSIYKSGVAVISMNDAVERIQDPGRHPARPRFVVITFDDGYADNLIYALPVLERFEAPFTLYVTTDMVEGSGYLWWLGVERLLLLNDAVDVPPMAKRFTTASLKEKAAALASVTAWRSSGSCPRRESRFQYCSNDPVRMSVPGTSGQPPVSAAPYGRGFQNVAEFYARPTAWCETFHREPRRQPGGHALIHDCASPELPSTRLV